MACSYSERRPRGRTRPEGNPGKNSYWFLLFMASWQLSLTAPVEPPDHAHLPWQEPTELGTALWHLSPQGPRCRLTSLAGCHPKHLPRQRASLPIKWTLRARDCRFVSHHGTSYTSKQQQKEVVTTCMSWENLLLSQNFSLSCLLTPKWLAHLYIQRHKAGLAASSCEHKFHNIPQGERATRDFPVWISKKNVKETATICG